MAITSAIVAATASVAGTGYGIYQQSKQAKQPIPATDPRTPAIEQAQADMIAARAGTVQKKRTQAARGAQSTILTGPRGTGQSEPPAAKTLLGL